MTASHPNHVRSALALGSLTAARTRTIGVAMEDEAFERLYSRFGPATFAHCRGILHDDAAAEDASQETFLRVHSHLAKAPNAREALFWIYRIATNVCLSELRRRRRKPFAVCNAVEALAIAFGDDVIERDAVARIFGSAPGKVREVAWLHFVSGLDQAEVAEALDVSRGTVVNRLNQFRDLARKLLGRST